MRMASNTAHLLASADPMVQAAMRDPQLTVIYDETEGVFCVTAHTVAAFVVLEHPRKIGDEKVLGHFENNAFWMLPGVKKVAWASQGGPSPLDWADGVTVMSMWDLVVKT